MGGGYVGPGAGSGQYRMPPSLISGGGYPESGHYGHSSASAYPGQRQPVGSSWRNEAKQSTKLLTGEMIFSYIELFFLLRSG